MYTYTRDGCATIEVLIKLDADVDTGGEVANTIN